QSRSRHRCSWTHVQNSSSSRTYGLRNQPMRSRRFDANWNLSDLVTEIDRRLRILDAEATSLQNLLVDARVEIGKPVAELDFVAVNVDRAEGRFAANRRLERKIRAVARQEPSDACALKPDESASSFCLAQVDLVLDHGAEQPDQQIEQMDAD